MQTLGTQTVAETSSTALVAPGAPSGRSWQASYVRAIVLADLFCALGAALVGYAVRFGTESLEHVPFWVVVAFPLTWVGAMLVARSYEQRFLWLGAEEFRRVFFAAMLMLAAVGTVSCALKLDLARGFVVRTGPCAC